MDRLLLLIVPILVLFGCSNSKKERLKENQYLDRIELSLSSNLNTIYKSFDLRYAYNPAKWGDLHYEALFIKKSTDSIFRIVHKTKGQNIDRAKIIDHFKGMLVWFDIKNEDLKLVYDYRLDHWRSIPQRKFNNLAFAIDLRLCTIDLLNEIYMNKLKSGYGFNVLKPIIIESDNTVKPGELYTAYIGVLGYDSTRFPEYKMDDNYLEVINGKGVFRGTYSESGIKEINGTIIIPTNNFSFDTLYYNGTLHVN